MLSASDVDPVSFDLCSPPPRYQPSFLPESVSSSRTIRSHPGQSEQPCRCSTYMRLMKAESVSSYYTTATTIGQSLSPKDWQGTKKGAYRLVSLQHRPLIPTSLVATTGGSSSGRTTTRTSRLGRRRRRRRLGLGCHGELCLVSLSNGGARRVLVFNKSLESNSCQNLSLKNGQPDREEGGGCHPDYICPPPYQLTCFPFPYPPIPPSIHPTITEKHTATETTRRATQSVTPSHARTPTPKPMQPSRPEAML